MRVYTHGGGGGGGCTNPGYKQRNQVLFLGLLYKPFMQTCMYICVYMYTCICADMNVHICVYVHMYVETRMYIYTLDYVAHYISRIHMNVHACQHPLPD